MTSSEQGAAIAAPQKWVGARRGDTMPQATSTFGLSFVNRFSLAKETIS